VPFTGKFFKISWPNIGYLEGIWKLANVKIIEKNLKKKTKFIKKKQLSTIPIKQLSF